MFPLCLWRCVEFSGCVWMFCFLACWAKAPKCLGWCGVVSGTWTVLLLGLAYVGWHWLVVPIQILGVLVAVFSGCILILWQVCRFTIFGTWRQLHRSHLAALPSFGCHLRTTYHPSFVSWGTEWAIFTMAMVHCGQLSGSPGSFMMKKPSWLDFYMSFRSSWTIFIYVWL
jgi:hypothetical protein